METRSGVMAETLIALAGTLGEEVLPFVDKRGDMPKAPLNDDGKLLARFSEQMASIMSFQPGAEAILKVWAASHKPWMRWGAMEIIAFFRTSEQWTPTFLSDYIASRVLIRAITGGHGVNPPLARKAWEKAGCPDAPERWIPPKASTSDTDTTSNEASPQ
jgi:hypothetical protein